MYVASLDGLLSPRGPPLQPLPPTLRAREVEPKALRDALPVPDADPLATLHEAPDLVEQLADELAVAQARVAPHGADGGADLLALRRREARAPDDQARHQQ